MKLLYAEDERAMSEAVCDILTYHKYIVDAVYDGKTALDYAESGDYDGIILDIMMPGLDGLEVLKRLRAGGCKTPVLLLTAKAEIEDQVSGLDMGADDYLPKPFPMELLMLNKGIYLSTEDLLVKIWGYETDAELGVVWVYISYLRKRLAALGADVAICTFMSSNFFVVCFDANGEAIRCDVSRTSSVTEAEAVNMACNMIENGKTGGRDGKFRFAVKAEPSGGKTAVFLDTSDEIFPYIRVLFLSAALGAACWILMLFIVILLSKRAIRPIAENIERQKQFVTNAGHEIKTPLAIIRSNTDAMELYNGENKWSRNIREQTERLDGLMKNLLMLSRMDEGIYNIRTVRFSLSGLLEGVMFNFSQPLEAKRVDVTTDIQPSVEIDADEGSIEQLISILLENAVKYVNENGYVSVSLHKNERTVKMRITNSCEKLPEAPPNKLFERFYRDDAARTQKNGGYGIGLSAARAVVHANKGEIYAEYIQPDAICFTVVFKCR